MGTVSGVSHGYPCDQEGDEDKMPGSARRDGWRQGIPENSSRNATINVNMKTGNPHSETSGNTSLSEVFPQTYRNVPGRAYPGTAKARGNTLIRPGP